MKSLARKWKEISDKDACIEPEHQQQPPTALRSVSKQCPARDWIIYVEREVWFEGTIFLEPRGIYTILIGYVGKNGENPFPSLETLIKGREGEEGSSEYLKELERIGLIEIIHRHKDANGKWLSNEYRLIRPLGGFWNRRITVGQNRPTKKDATEGRRGGTEAWLTACKPSLPTSKPIRSTKISQPPEPALA